MVTLMLQMGRKKENQPGVSQNLAKQISSIVNPGLREGWASSRSCGDEGTITPAMNGSPVCNIPTNGECTRSSY